MTPTIYPAPIPGNEEKPKRYSQGLEEDFILSVFREPIYKDKAKRFLDIGAWNPTDKSNTRALYELGWSGVMIEPSPGPMLNLVTAYGNDPRIQLVSAAVSGVPEGFSVVRMHISDDAVSTTEEKEFQKWKDATPFHGSVIVPAITVGAITHLFGEFDFISIDTEGTSVDIFEEFIRLGHKPACICVEYNDRKNEALAYAARSQYALIHENENNLIFQRIVQ